MEVISIVAVIIYAVNMCILCGIFGKPLLTFYYYTFLFFSHTWGGKEGGWKLYYWLQNLIK